MKSDENQVRRGGFSQDLKPALCEKIYRYKCINVKRRRAKAAWGLLRDGAGFQVGLLFFPAFSLTADAPDIPGPANTG